MRDYRLSSRYRLKSGYQRNMVFAWLFIVVFIIVPVWIISSLGPDSRLVRLTVRGAYIRSDTVIAPSSASPAKRCIGGRQRENKFGGFATKVKIISEHQVIGPVISSLSPKVYVPGPVPIINDSPLSIFDSDIENGLTDEYISSDDYMYGEDTRSEIPVNRPCSVIVKIDPEYPLVAREQKKEGRVILVVLIDSLGDKSVFPDSILAKFRSYGLQVYTLKRKLINGKKKEFSVAVVKENPSDWFFASNLLKVIPKWKFSPWIENGRTVPSFLIIKYDYRLSRSCPFKLEKLSY